MVHALNEAHRVLRDPGILLDVMPVTAPIVIEVIRGDQARWSAAIETYSQPDDVAAAVAAIRNVASSGQFVARSTSPFDFAVYCDTAEELRVYVEARKLQGVAIPYAELEDRRRALSSRSRPARLRCRRPWMLTAYRKQ